MNLSVEGETAASKTMTAPEAPTWSVASSSLLANGDRRFEARSYLADGYGLRRLIEAEHGGWRILADLASVWQPSRLKGVVVPEGSGVPFLSAGQVFEARPRVRKWLSERHTPGINERLVEPNWLLLSRSGNVGRVTAVYPHHLNVVVTDDLIRVVPHEHSNYSWLYAYMKTPQFRAMAQAAQYGHVIKHLEVEHVSSMPIISPSSDVKDRCSDLVSAILYMRQRSSALRDEAESRYAKLLGLCEGHPEITDISTSINSKILHRGRRRLDAAFFSPNTVNITKLIACAPTTSVDTVGSVCKSVGLGNRFKRYFGPKGTPYRSAEELFDMNAPVTKRVYAGLIDEPDQYMLRRGWIIMARSGQIYGLNGQALLIGSAHDGIFGSDDLIRIVPNIRQIAAGYLWIVLTHPILGRPMVIRNAYGTSIPHLDPVDVREVPVPRFAAKDEAEIAILAEESAQLRDQADMRENEAVELAGRSIEDFIHHLTDRSLR